MTAQAFPTSAAIREATRRWKVCEHGPDATCQRGGDEPRWWCDACVARALLEFTVRVSGEEPEPDRPRYPRMAEAQRRRRAEERAAASPSASTEQK